MGGGNNSETQDSTTTTTTTTTTTVVTTTTAAAAAKPTPALSLSIEAEYAAYARGEGSAAVVVHVQGAPQDSLSAKATDTRNPLDLVAVLDVSGSMGGDKLKLLAETVRFIVKQLRAVDTLAIVTFDSSVATVLPPTPMTPSGKSKATRACDALRAGSCTNLSGGLFEGCRHVNSTLQTQEQAAAAFAASSASASAPTAAATRVASILLLTDGIANEGVTVQAELVAATTALMGGRRYPIYSFGYGADHQPALLKALSDAGGGGVYYFIEKIETVPAAFGDCLGGLLTTVAQNMALTVSLPAGAASYCCIDSVDTAYAHSLSADKATLTVNLGDLQAEEARDVVLTLKLAALPDSIPAGAADGALPHLTASLSYVNLVQPGFGENTAELCLSRPLVAPAEQPASELVREQLARVMAAKALKEALALAERGDLPSARYSLQACMAAPQMQQSPHAAAWQSNLADCYKSMESSTTFARSGHHKMSAAAQSHMQQRANKVDMSEMSEEEAATTSYVTPAKRSSRATFLSFINAPKGPAAPPS